MRIFSRRLGVRGVALAGLVFIGAAATTTAQAIPQSEADTLEALYKSTGGEGWYRNDNWLDPTPCSWYGITCTNIDNDWHVTRIDLFRNSLINSLSKNPMCPNPDRNSNPPLCSFPDLSALPYLRVFNVAGSPRNPFFFNDLEGPFPDISGLSSLEYFNVSFNRLTGSLPDISGLSSLTYFNVSNNGIVVGLLPDISGLSSLKYFNVSGNRLSGPLPDLIGLEKLEIFDASFNSFSGAFPKVLDLLNLKEFDVSHNSLMGPLPDVLWELSAMIRFDVSYNQLSGPLTAPPRALIDRKLAFLCPNHFEMVTDAKHFWQNLAWTMATGGQWPNSSWWNARSDEGYPACTPN